jgi:hypothetical protein
MALNGVTGLLLPVACMTSPKSLVQTSGSCGPQCPSQSVTAGPEIVYDTVGLTYDIVYDVTYYVVRTIGKNSILTYDVTYDVVREHYIVYDIVGQYTISYTTLCTIWCFKHCTRCHLLYTM